MKKKIGTAMVVGGGISGIRSALDLAEVGYQVKLIDQAPHLGGILSQLDYQFPTDRCSMCKMLPLVNRDASSQFCLRKGFFHENIEVQLSTELVSIEGDPGKFLVKTLQQPSWVDQNLCTGCGDCVEKCPEEIADSFNLGLNRRKAIYLPVPHNIPNTYVIDFDACTKCGDCVDVCPTKAITIPEQDLEPLQSEMEVGAVVLSGGTAYYDPATGKDTYGYGTYSDVVTSREFERILSGTGPNQGRLLRPSDGKPVRKIAWFQCVGSRDKQSKSEFCSSVCCMHAIKEARLAKTIAEGDLETAIFYMDMRTYNKSFQRYRDLAEGEHDIRFERSRVHSVTQLPDQDDLNVVHIGIDGTRIEEKFDMVVLSVGQRPSVGTKELAETAGINLNQWGFCQPETFRPSSTNREGISLSGSFSGLRDISESVIQAGSASLSASLSIHATGGSQEEIVESPVELRNVSTDIPKVLVVVCVCGLTLPKSFDQEQLKTDLHFDQSVEDVVFIEQTCTSGGWESLEETLISSRANRVLIGACLPHIYDQKLREISKKTGLDTILTEVIDIRPSGSDFNDESRANRGIANALKIGISRLKRADTEPVITVPINQRALVIGGGISGMTAALAIADHGFDVDLVEEQEKLGGNLAWLRETLEGNQTETLLQGIVGRVEGHSQVTVHTQAKVADTIGEAGKFLSTVSILENENPIALEHGVTILATGGDESATESFGYGSSPAIVTQKELDQKFEDQTIDPANLNSVVMIQCVGSREEPRNYCSRVCCASSIKNALLLKEKNPDIAVYVFYRDIMAYGYAESYYSEARSAGVVFIQYALDQKPEVRVEDKTVIIKGFEPILGRDIKIEADLLVLATGVVPKLPHEVMKSLALDADQDGFFKEADSKWRPVDSLKEGVFACGLVHSPRNINESIASAEAAAQRALRLLSSEEMAAGTVVAEVRHSLCILCELCIAACPYGARQKNSEEQIEVNPLMCQGCGSCATTCRNSASVLRGYRDQQMFDVIDMAMVPN